ncbi:MAG: hypothetical protein U0R18_18780 [Mycobacterium sp.]
MDTVLLIRVLLWSLVVNYAVLIVWFVAFAVGRDRIQRLHGRWFRLSDNTFDAIHYGGMAFYKLAIVLFNLGPLIALWVVR